MGHKNDLLFVLRNKHRIAGRVLEVGAKCYPHAFIDYRSRFPDFVGLDMEAGDNVDVVHDLTAGPLEDWFDCILCLNVLEHTRKPWVVARNVVSMLKPGGLLIAGTPWIWRMHNYPGDYCRFSVSGLRELFDGEQGEAFEWVDEAFTTTCVGEFLDGDEPFRKGFRVDDGEMRRNAVVSEIAYVAGVKRPV